MKKTDREFNHQSLQDQESITDYLEALAEGFRNGTLKFSDSEGDILMRPHGLIHFEVDASNKRDRVRLSLRFTWKPRDEEQASSGPLRIDSGDDEEAEDE